MVLLQVYETEEWHQSLDLRPASAMRLVHIAVTKSTIDVGSVSAGTRFVHLIARIYMVAVVPVIGYILYASVRNKIRAAREGNSTATISSSPNGSLLVDVMHAVNQSAADAFLDGAHDEL